LRGPAASSANDGRKCEGEGLEISSIGALIDFFFGAKGTEPKLLFVLIAPPAASIELFEAKQGRLCSRGTLWARVGELDATVGEDEEEALKI
jgi:hypothetical protein